MAHVKPFFHVVVRLSPALCKSKAKLFLFIWLLKNKIKGFIYTLGSSDLYIDDIFGKVPIFSSAKCRYVELVHFFMF